MNRRYFIKTALSSVLIPCGILAAKAGPPEVRTNSADYFFYDDRFTDAHQLAEKLSTSKQLIPVQGDITGLWNAELGRACHQSPLIMHGVTTESFYFCLRVMLGPFNAESQINRLNRDLHIWTIRSYNILKTG